MAGARGFLSNRASVAGITTAYDLTKVIRMTGAPMNSAKPPSPTVTVVDVKARLAPQSGYWGNIRIVGTVTAGIPATITGIVYWDSTCDQKAYGPGTFTMDPGLTTAAQRGGVCPIDEIFTAPTSQTTKGEVYLMLKTDAGTITITRVEIEWRDSP